MSIGLTDTAEAGGPWSDQYCNLRTETIIIKDAAGNIIDTKTTEKVVCEDGAMDFLHGAKIASRAVRCSRGGCHWDRRP
jgi:hypothetical protein